MTSLFQIDLFAMILKGILIGIMSRGHSLHTTHTEQGALVWIHNGGGRCRQRYHLRYVHGVWHVICRRLYQQSGIQILSSDSRLALAVAFRHLYLHDETQESDPQERQSERNSLAQRHHGIPRDVQQSAHHLSFHVDVRPLCVRYSSSSLGDDSRICQHFVWGTAMVVRTDLACRQNPQQV